MLIKFGEKLDTVPVTAKETLNGTQSEREKKYCKWPLNNESTFQAEHYRTHHCRNCMVTF